MDKALYISMTGASEIMKAQATRTNNLANMGTTAFKLDEPALCSLPVEGAGLPSRVYVGTANVGTHFSAGQFVHTGNPMDVSLKDAEGWFVVQTLDKTGAPVERYSRRGDFRPNRDNLLENGAGQLLLGEGGPIVIPPHQKLEIAKDGSVYIWPPNAESSAPPLVLDKMRLVRGTHEQLVKDLNGTFRTKSEGGLEIDPTLALETHVLESSNVNPVAEMLEILNLSRQQELNVKLMKSIEENDKVASSILQM